MNSSVNYRGYLFNASLNHCLQACYAGCLYHVSGNHGWLYFHLRIQPAQPGVHHGRSSWVSQCYIYEMF